MKKEDVKVGDIVRDKQQGDATVTEITERGFKYTLKEQFVAHHRLNMVFVGGEVYLDDEFLQKTCHWTLVKSEE